MNSLRKMAKIIRIGTRESQLAIWQAEEVKKGLEILGYASELVLIESEGDIDLKTPLYEIGVQGIFTRSLDIALLTNKIDIAVHSMKDVPTQLAKGIAQAAVLKRASYKDLLVWKGEWSVISSQLGFVNGEWTMVNNPAEPSFPIHYSPFTIATSSIRRKAQWLNRYPLHNFENLRGNVNTRLHKLKESTWQGAIFAAAGLERISLRPENSIDLDWMLPAPAQGAIMVACREEDSFYLKACEKINDAATALCTKVERDFLRTLLGGCSTPISALAEVKDDKIYFKGNIVSPDGKEKEEIEMSSILSDAGEIGIKAAHAILNGSGKKIVEEVRSINKKLNL
jgi:hydroxymethylbilane synthase